MSKAQPSFSFPDLKSVFPSAPFAGFDFEAAATRQQKAVEAVMEASRVAADGYQSVVKRQLELVRTSLDRVNQVYQDAAETGSAADFATRQAELNREAFELAVKHVREIAEIAGETNAEAVRVMQAGLSDQFKPVEGQGDRETRSTVSGSVKVNATRVA